MGMRKSKGNMYSWATHTHSHLGGECPHQCSYCYVENPRFGRPEKYKGELRLIEKEFDVNYGSGKTIFIENCNDMFADEVPESFILQIFQHCIEWPSNTYVFQTKNPGRYFRYLLEIPRGSILGCTIETNREIFDVSKAPAPEERAQAMCALKQQGFHVFITVEPILDFDVMELVEMIEAINPDFLNIGADSKGHGLNEPSADKIKSLVESLDNIGININRKSNLERLDAER